MSRRRKLILAAVLPIGFCAALFVLDQILPYSFDHCRRIHSINVASAVGELQYNGEFEENLRRIARTNDMSKLYYYNTTIVYRGTSYQTVLRLERDSLRGRGYLVGTPEKKVFWVGNDGAIKQTRESRKNEESSR